MWNTADLEFGLRGVPGQTYTPCGVGGAMDQGLNAVMTTTGKTPFLKSSLNFGVVN